MANITISDLEQTTVVDPNMLLATDAADQTYAISVEQIKDFVTSGLGSVTESIANTDKYTDIDQLKTGTYAIYSSSGILCGGEALPSALNNFYANIMRIDDNNMAFIAQNADNVRMSRFKQNGAWLPWQTEMQNKIASSINDTPEALASVGILDICPKDLGSSLASGTTLNGTSPAVTLSVSMLCYFTATYTTASASAGIITLERKIPLGWVPILKFQAYYSATCNSAFVYVPKGAQIRITTYATLKQWGIYGCKI